jgi:hypothetical protein
MNTPDDLQMLDALLYGHFPEELLKDPEVSVSLAIQGLTLGPVSHVEGFAGLSRFDSTLSTWASRDGKGVAKYPFNPNGLVAVARPVWTPNVENAEHYFSTVNGEGYDWAGDLGFIDKNIPASFRKDFCSSFYAKLCMASGEYPFNEFIPPRKITPYDYLKSKMFKIVWWDARTVQ